MSASSTSPAEMLLQLESARKMALADPQVYLQVIPGILPIIGPTALLDVRRWGVEFLAEGFASPSLSNSSKEQLIADVLPILKTILESPDSDPGVVKYAVQASASIYPLAFSHIISHPDQTLLWRDMSAMKLNIQSRMDSASTTVKLCCIKFLQKVVQVQTPGLIADPRRPERNETSIALVPRNHPLLPLQNLEAEASGLLDRLLSTLQEQSRHANHKISQSGGKRLTCHSDPVIVDATMNCLAVLIRTRPAVANKILSAILNYNPFKSAAPNMTPRQMVIIKSLERTTRALLRYVLKIFQNHSMQQKIEVYLQRLSQTRTALFTESHSLKRPAESTEGIDDHKRQRLVQLPRRFPSIHPPPNSFAHLFTLTEDTTLQQFDVKLLPPDMVSNIVGLLLQHIDSKSLDEAIEEVRQRYAQLVKAAQPTPVPEVPMAGPTGIDDDDDYDPEGFAANSGDLVMSEAQSGLAANRALEEVLPPVIELGPFELPKPPPLTSADIAVLSDQTFNGVFDVAKQLEHHPQPQNARPKSGLNRLAASSNDSQAWMTLLSRIATRSTSGLDDFVQDILKNSDMDNNDNEDNDNDDDGDEDDSDGDSPEAMVKQERPANSSVAIQKPTLADKIRYSLFTYILEDWRARLNVAISWLTEEWYADKVASSPSTSPSTTTPSLKTSPTRAIAIAGTESALPLPSDDETNTLLPNYTQTLSQLVTHLIPRFDASDSKLLIRFLSEIPHLSRATLDQIKQLAFDPVTMKICILALQYLVMFRPPARTMAIDCLESIWREAGGGGGRGGGGGPRENDDDDDNDDGSGVRAEVAKVLKRWRPSVLAPAVAATATASGQVQVQVQVPPAAAAAQPNAVPKPQRTLSGRVIPVNGGSASVGGSFKTEPQS